MSIKITTKFLPKGIVGEEYSCQLTAEVNPPSKIIWRAMSKLPNSLFLNPETGLISGTCEKAFKGTFGVEVESLTENEKATKALPLIITEHEPLEIVTKGLPVGVVGEPYTAKLIAKGGVRPYQWIVVGLPEEFEEVDGEISGTPTENGSYVISVTVRDSASNSKSQQKDFTLDIKTAIFPPIINSFGANWKEGNLELVWDIENPAEVRIQQLPSATITGETLTITSSQEHPILSRYTLIATNADGSAASIIEATSLEKVETIALSGYPLPIAESSTAESVFVGCVSLEGQFLGFNTKTLLPLTNSPVPNILSVTSMAISPDGLRIFAAELGHKALFVLDAQTFTVIQEFSYDSAPVLVAISPCGSILYMTFQLWPDLSKSILKAYKSDTLEEILEKDLEYSPMSISVSPDGKRIYLPNADLSNTVTVLSSDTLLPIPESPVLGFDYPSGVKFSSCGSLVYVLNADSASITILNAKTLNPTMRPSFPVGGVLPYYFAISPDGLRLYTSNNESNTVSILSSKTLDGSTVPVGKSPMQICASRDGSRIYVGDSLDNALSVLRPVYKNINDSPLA